jgi:hypothetical protein
MAEKILTRMWFVILYSSSFVRSIAETTPFGTAKTWSLSDNFRIPATRVFGNLQHVRCSFREQGMDSNHRWDQNQGFQSVLQCDWTTETVILNLLPANILSRDSESFSWRRSKTCNSTGNLLSPCGHPTVKNFIFKTSSYINKITLKRIAPNETVAVYVTDV